MQVELGSVLEGKVTGITKFGAFVDIGDGKSGMVHISEISNTYVENVADFLSEGDQVKVKVIGINENGKISLSIKKLTEAPETTAKRGYNKGQKERKNAENRTDRKQSPRPTMKSRNSPGDFVWQKSENPTSFEDMMSKFKQTSDEKISSLKRGSENPVRRPRRK